MEMYVRWRKFECPLCNAYWWEGHRRQAVAEALVKDERRLKGLGEELDEKFSMCPFHRVLEGYFRRVRECWWKTKIRAVKPYKITIEAWSRNGTLFYIAINPFAWWVGGEEEGSEEGVYVGFGEDTDVFYVLPLRDFLLFAPRRWAQAFYEAVVLLPEQEQEQHKEEQTVES